MDSSEPPCFDFIQAFRRMQQGRVSEQVSGSGNLPIIYSLNRRRGLSIQPVWGTLKKKGAARSAAPFFLK
jgi:hypothetical protein